MTKSAFAAILSAYPREYQISQDLPQLNEQEDVAAAQRRALESIEKLLLPRIESVAAHEAHISAIQRHLELQQADLEKSFNTLADRLTVIEKRIDELRAMRDRLDAIDGIEKRQEELESRLRRVLQAANMGSEELMGKVAGAISRLESQTARIDRAAESTESWLKELSATCSAITEKLRLQQERMDLLEAGADEVQRTSRGGHNGNGDNGGDTFSRDIQPVSPAAARAISPSGKLV